MANPNSLNETTATVRVEHPGPETTQSGAQSITKGVVRGVGEGPVERPVIVRDGDGVVQHVTQPVSNPSKLQWAGQEKGIMFWGDLSGLEYGSVAYFPDAPQGHEGKPWRAKAWIAPSKAKVRWFKARAKAMEWVEQHAYQPVANPGVRAGCCGGKNPGCCMNPLSHAERSAVSKRTWRSRKQERGKATCFFCTRPIYAGGVKVGKLHTYHKTCFAYAKAGLRPEQVGLDHTNPRGKPLPSSLRGITSVTKKLEGNLWMFGSGRERHVLIAELAVRGWRYLGTKEGPDQWLVDQYGLTDVRQIELPFKGSVEQMWVGRPTNEKGRDELQRLVSERLPKIERETLPRKVAQRYVEGEGGSAPSLNPRSAPGKSTRPPAKWWAMMLPRIKAEYPKFGKRRIAQVTAGVWHGYDNATQDRLIREYEGTPRGNPDSLSCPGCNQGVGSLGAGTYRCDGCGAEFQVS